MQYGNGVSALFDTQTQRPLKREPAVKKNK